MKNTPKNPYLIKMPKKILAKFSDLKKSWKQKFQTKKMYFSHLRHMKFGLPPLGSQYMVGDGNKSLFT